jgi:chemosensory pili system protein ChpA (sensor histidine kinase/response regulator)
VSNRDLLLALADELAQGEELLGQSIGVLTEPQIPEEFVKVAAEDYRAFTARVSGVAEAVNLGSLQELIGLIDTNLSMFVQSREENHRDENVLRLLQHWPGILSRFMRESGNVVTEAELREFFSDEHWLSQFSEAQSGSLINTVRSFSISSEKTSLDVEEEELTEPSPADVSVSIPDDISPKLLATFQQELPQTTAELSQRIQKLFDKSATGEDLSEARRVAHTLKGAANIVGVTGIANVTHYLEDILELLVNKSVLPSRELSEVLTEAADCLEMMSEAALGVSEPPAQALQVLNSLLEWRHKFANDRVEGLEPIEAQAEAANDSAGHDETQGPVTDTRPERPAAANIQSNIFDKLLDIAGELSSTSLLTQGQLQAAIKNAESLARMHGRLRANMILLQDMVFSRGLKKAFISGQFAAAQRNFDPLEMDQYNELHSIANLMTELMDDVGDVSKTMMAQHAQMRELLSQQDQLNKELDQSVTAERLVSIKTILPRLQRSVRQTCRMLDKKAELMVTGDSVSIDSAILDAIVDPLLHMLRNAVDHGIESPAERIALDKPEQATISLVFERVGNNFVISCKDDGRGINTSAVKHKALKLGLIKTDQILHESALHELILLPGFSTKHDADQISGRGVGMDVVAKNIADQRGSISIRSEEGRGTEFRITVPQTLLKMHVVLLRSGEFKFGVLSNSFNQIVSIGTDLFLNEEQQIDFNDQIYEVRNLTGLLGIPKYRGSLRDRKPVAILVDEAESRTATLIDDAVGSGELVIKKIGRYVPRIGGIVGTVLTEDGAAVPVFDLKELLRRPSQVVADYLQKHVDQPAPSAANVLIVDDSSSARRSMSQVVRDAGYDVRTAIDGIEAISLIEERIPDLILTDLEMPKMNGLELTAHLRAAENTRDLPIVMVTSRSTEKHKDQAISTGVNRYITKPFTNDDLVYEMHQLLIR